MSDWRHRSWSQPLEDESYRMAVWDRLRKNALVSDVGCWEWQLYRNQDGYGLISVKKRMVQTHQVSLAISRGAAWSAELEVDHLCRNRGCCNPEHLELVEPAENYRRGLGSAVATSALRAKTHCKQGHLYDDANTYIRPGRNGRGPSRRCRKCRTAGMSRAYWARKASS